MTSGRRNALSVFPSTVVRKHPEGVKIKRLLPTANDKFSSESVLLSVQIILGKKLRDCHEAVIDGSNKGALQEFSEELVHIIGIE